MRIVQICADRGVAPGATKGAAQHLRGVAAGFSALGHSVTTFSARAAEGAFPVPVLPLKALSTDVVATSSVVYERYSIGHRRGLDLARAAGVPFVLEVNAPLIDEATAHRPDTVEPAHAMIERELIADADLVITVSTHLAAWVGQRRSGPTITIPNGFEPEWFERPAMHPRFDLVFLGHPKPWHGADRLPGLLQDLAGQDLRASLLVIGGGPGAADLEHAGARLGVSRQIHVTGTLSPASASALVGSARIGLAPYPELDLFYFCPLKVIDYMAAGIPVVATSQGDIPALVGNAGVVVPPHDTRAFTAAIVELLRDEPRRQQLGRLGRETAHGAFTWRHVATRTLEAIESSFAMAS